MQNRVPLSLKTQSLKRDIRYVRYIEHIKHIKSGIKRVLFCAYLVLAFLSLSACEQQKQPQVNADKQQDNALKETQQDQSITEIFSEGFYGDQEGQGELVSSAKLNTPLPDQELDKESVQELGQELSQELEPIQQESQDDVAANDDDFVDEPDPNTKLIKDLGFSPAEELLTTNEMGVPAKPYCLNTDGAITESKTSITIEEACRKISNRLASVTMNSCLAAKLKYTGCASVKDFPILVSEFLPIKGKTPQGRILLVGGTHGDELTSVSTTFRWIDKLNRFHSGLFNWRLIPMMNPDGVLNRHAQRTNHNGVDLNRNLPSEDWENTALKYWETKVGKNPRRYPGTSPASEPETQWLLDEINTFKPDVIISIHAPYGVVDFDSLLLNTAPKSLGKLHLNLLGTYPGSLGNYAGINLNIPVITLELPNAWEMPSQKETTKIWEDIVQWLKKNIKPEDLPEDTDQPS